MQQITQQPPSQRESYRRGEGNGPSHSTHRELNTLLSVEQTAAVAAARGRGAVSKLSHALREVGSPKLSDAVREVGSPKLSDALREVGSPYGFA